MLKRDWCQEANVLRSDKDDTGALRKQKTNGTWRIPLEIMFLIDQCMAKIDLSASTSARDKLC